MNKTPVGILGATGMVGQRFIQLLESHPWFEVAWLAASERSAGQRYADVCRWKLATPMPERVAVMTVSGAAPDQWTSDAPRIIFAALDSKVASEIEPAYCAAGRIVISNSSALRMHPDVPLLIPEVNAEHLALIEQQAARTLNRAYAVTNPNCSATGLVMALAPLHRAFGVEQVFVSTMQAVSGAGYPGVASLDILGNVVPYIGGEEEKMESETQKMLGTITDGAITPAPIRVSAHCNRVPVEDGHTESVSIKFAKPVSREEILAAWREFRGEPQQFNLPSAPAQPIVYMEAQDRPQPRLDAYVGKGMSTVVGRLRPCNLFDWKFTVLSHNTIRGAAGAAILNAELLHAKGLLA
jgi:aspartate-semialdehyde dehydrogenase